MDTTSLGFQKPKEEEYYDINIFNKNTQLANDLIEKNSSAIGQIANDRGYVKIKSLGSLDDLNNIFGSGKYFSNQCLNRPISTDAFLIDVTGDGNSVVVQKATCYYGAGNVNFGKIYERIFYQASGGWTSWREIPTVNNISNPNLIINGDFQIWQRGTSFENITSTTTNRYTADRWLTQASPSANVNVIKDTDGSFKFTQVGNYASNCRQYIEGEYKELAGKKITFSMFVKNNAPFIMGVFNGLNYIDSKNIEIGEYRLVSLTVQLPTNIQQNALNVIFYFNNTAGTINVKYAKLELGEIATLLSPRSYGEELALCQRYCVSQLLVGLPYIIDTTYLWFFVPLAESLRITPSLIAGNMGVMVSGITQTGFTFSNLQGTTNGVYLLAMKPNHGLTKDITLFSSTAIFDAEIY